MVRLFRNLRLSVKVALLGAGSVLITVLALVSLAVWQSDQYNTLAQREVDALINADLDHITQGVYNLVRTENEAVQQQVDYNLNVARHVLAKAGGVSLSDETVNWTATNQFTNTRSRIQLPQMVVDGKWLGRNTDPGVESAIVDEVTRLVGETATIFQRMNEQGDMIRVATTVRDAAGRRAIGTYIPAVDAGGKPNPVIAAVMKDKTYHGRAFVVNTWYLTAYEPIRDKTGQLVGMLYVGVKQKTVELRVRQAILQTRVGKTGYIYVLGGKGEDRGRYIISQRGERDGEDIWENKDSDGGFVIQTIIKKATALKAGELATERYRWRNPGEPKPRWKVARLAYYEPWDWVIGTSVYEDELQNYRAVLSGGQIRMTTIMGLAGLTITLLIGLASIFMAWTIARPVRQLTDAAETIIRGDLNQVVEVHSQDEIGSLARTFNIMTDMLRQTVEGLRKSEEKYRSIYENSLEGLFQSSFEGRFLSANPAMARILGYQSPDELLAGISDIKQQLYVCPDDRNVIVSTILEEAEVIDKETQFYCRDGKKIWVSISARKVNDEAGKPLFIEGFLTDISDRRRAEEELKASQQQITEQLLFMEALLTAMPIPVFYKDAHLRYLGCNAAYAQLIGITPEELKGKTVHDFWPYELAEMYDRKDQDLLQQREVQTYDFQVKDKNGEIRDVIFRKSVFLNEDGSVGGIIGTYFDITEQKRAETARCGSERRLSDIINFLPDATLAIDEEKRIIIWNRAIEEMTGISAEEMIGKGGYAYTVPFYGVARPQLMDLFWEPESDVAAKYPLLQKEGDNLVIEVFCPALYDGKGAFVFAKASPLRNAEGRLIGAIECIRDITERKRVEGALEESRRELESLMSNLPGMAYRCRNDREWTMTFVSEGCHALTGYTPDDLMNNRRISYNEIIHPDDREAVWNQVREALERQLHFRFNYRIVTAKGDVRWVLEQGAGVHSSTGELVFLEGFITDITERKRAEEALKLNAERLDSLLRINQMADATYQEIMNFGFEEAVRLTKSKIGYLGLMNEDETVMTVQVWSRGVMPECDVAAGALDFPLADAGLWAEAVRQRRPMITNDYSAANPWKKGCPEGHIGITRHMSVPVFVGQRIVLLAGVGNKEEKYDETDIRQLALLMEGMWRLIERKQAQEERRKLENQLIQAQKLEAIGTLAGGIAHDFNNILSGIMGYSELSLEAMQDRPKVCQYMEQVVKAAERAKDLVGQILTFSRKAEREKKPITLTPIIKEVVNFMRASLPTTIEITQKIAETSDVIMADPTQMHQVLVNLCTNAGHAMKKTGGVLEIGLEEAVSSADDRLQSPPIRHGHYLILTVRDTGHGISQENIARIFEPYFTTKEKGEGTGLGLAVVHGIVKDHGGEIRAYSEVGKGTIFRVYLPLMERQKEGGKDKDSEEVLLPGKGEKILLIDDEKMVAQLIKKLLEDLGYRVVAETDPVKAIEAFKEGSDEFDLVITDKTMPRLTGFDVAREIRCIRADIPILLCSGLQETGDMERLTGLGISRFIAKPIRKVVLAHAIREVLNK